MQRINCFLIFLCSIALYAIPACKKKEDKVYTPVPFLTGRVWKADTITVNPPLVYSQLGTTDKESLRQANAWFKIATLVLNDDGTVTEADYDFGYRTWRLVNNDKDIEMVLYNGNKQVLRNWVADATHFSYTNTLIFNPNTNFECTVVFK